MSSVGGVGVVGMELLAEMEINSDHNLECTVLRHQQYRGLNS